MIQICMFKGKVTYKGEMENPFHTKQLGINVHRQDNVSRIFETGLYIQCQMGNMILKHSFHILRQIIISFGTNVLHDKTLCRINDLDLYMYVNCQGRRPRSSEIIVSGTHRPHHLTNNQIIRHK